MKNEKPKQRMMVTVAHPDDESFGMGGTLGLYAQRGVEVHLVVLTGGEAGSVEPQYLEGYESIADRRAEELRCAAQTLGLASVEVGWYRDSGMEGSADNTHPNALINQPVEEVAQRLVVAMRKIRPQVIVTHDPIGGYRHPDHIAVHHATLMAFQKAGDSTVPVEGNLPPYQPQKLYYHTFPKGILKFIVKLLQLFGNNPVRFGRNKDINLSALVEEGDFPIHVKINTRPAIALRQAASACHASQITSGPASQGPLSLLFQLVAANDHYSRAFPPPEKGLRERDLFDQVKPE